MFPDVHNVALCMYPHNVPGNNCCSPSFLRAGKKEKREAAFLARQVALLTAHQGVRQDYPSPKGHIGPDMHLDDKKKDKEAAVGPSSSGAHSGAATLGYFIAVAKKSRAKTHPLPLRKSGHSSDVESAHRGAPSHPRSELARACERTCGVPYHLRVAKERRFGIGSVCTISRAHGAHVFTIRFTHATNALATQIARTAAVTPLQPILHASSAFRDCVSSGGRPRSRPATIEQCVVCLDAKNDTASNHFVQSVPGHVGTEMERLRRSADSRVNDWNDYTGP